MKKSLSMRLAGLVVLVVLGMALNAHALEVTPTSGVLNVSRFEGDETSQAQINAIIGPICGCLPELYKQDFGGGESGALAGSYTTTFSGDPNNFLIDYVGGPSIGPVAWLLVKDGAQGDPAWYFFNLTALGWNGTDDLVGTGFWLPPDQGAISHVSLYGTVVPEPSSILLLGFAFAGIGIAYRRWLRV